MWEVEENFSKILTLMTDVYALKSYIIIEKKYNISYIYNETRYVKGLWTNVTQNSQ